MGGVDKNDTIGNYSCIRTTKKWYTKIFFHLLEEAVYNAFVLSAGREEKEIHAIKLEIVCEMLEGASVTPNSRAEFDRFKGGHFPSLVLATEKKMEPYVPWAPPHI